MKDWLYIPFLILMAVTYTRISINYSEESLKPVSRGPASIEVSIEEECIDLPALYNPHFNSPICD